jgi:choline dehydrogenase
MAAEYDFIVVGSGAGGGPLACNLALAPEGYRVALLEAGGDPAAAPGTTSYFNYAVPALHARASEDPETSWPFFVKHYTDVERQRQDRKFNTDKGGIFYPRAAALGGCTAHHAMITVYPHHDDWRNLATLTGDASWLPENMRGYFERLEDCSHAPRASADQLRDPATRHGLAGWLPVSMPDPTLALGDQELLKILFKAFLVAFVGAEPGSLATLLDPVRRKEPEQKRRHIAALSGAIDHLIQTAQTARDRLPATVREAVARLGAEGARLEALAAAKDDALGAFAEDPDLLELFREVHAWLDPNRWFEHDRDRRGPFNTPASILHGVRQGVRERILAVHALVPDRLVVIAPALATDVVIVDRRAVGVRYVAQEGLYQAAGLPKGAASLPPAQELRLRNRGEVILAAGAFNTPQLLMLSGVGPAADLRSHGIQVRCESPGVGQNLQDRYEIGLVSEVPQDFEVLRGSRFKAPAPGTNADDPALVEWQNHRGVYAANGVVLSIIRRSAAAEGDVPDLYIFGIPGYFRGYYSGYADETQAERDGAGWRENHHRFTWAILKGRTRNRAGEVRLRSADPREPPDINFKYFDEGSAGWQKDLDALVEGIRFAGQIMKATGLKLKTLVPDTALDDLDKLKEFIRREAWGHHACGTCQIGADADKNAVVDGDFRVRGVENLRVVDASVFPRIPGFFIVTPIYMISEKASDVILADRRREERRRWAKVAGT